MWGILVGVLIYVITAFPFAILAGVDGDAWVLVFFMYGLACGVVGFVVAGDA